MSYLDEMLAGYLQCAAWSTAGGEYRDDDCDFEHDSLEAFDYADAAVSHARRDCEHFIEAAGALLDGIDAEQAGHDFWLTREHHGAGFWGRGLGTVGDALTELAEPFGNGDLYLGDDMLLHFMGERVR